MTLQKESISFKQKATNVKSKPSRLSDYGKTKILTWMIDFGGFVLNAEVDQSSDIGKTSNGFISIPN